MIPFFVVKNLSAHGVFKVKHIRNVGSTNDWLKNLSPQKAKEGFVVVADEQTSGKGRLGRKFFSEKGGLYFSLLLKPASVEILDSLTTISAVAVCDAIREVSGDDARIKWVNDILIDDKKCSGILAETTENLKGFAIVGIGINIGKVAFDKSIKDIACSVAEVGRNTRWNLLEKILENIENLYFDFDKIKLVEAYKVRCSTIGRRIEVIENCGKKYIATAKSLDDNCRLVVEDEKGDEHVLDSGEVKIVL